MIPFIGPIIKTVGDIIDKVIPDKNAAAAAKAKINEMQAQGELDVVMKQLEINLAEAKNSNWFVAGWRPFIGWICGIGLLCDFSGLVHFDGTTTSLMLTTLGGLAGLRTYEKRTDTEGNR